MAFDVVIRGGRVLDGTGAPWRFADLGIRRGNITRIGRLRRTKAAREIDAPGMYVAPGFIDIHTHSDIGILVEPTPDELRAMKAHVEEAMRAGAFGMSTGLVYPPGCFADTDEIVELTRVVARRGGFYASHIRGERETIVGAVRECIEIGELAGCPVQISHNNPKYGGLGKSDEIQALWEAARTRGVDVLADNDAHTDFGPPLSHALPQWTQKLASEELRTLLADPVQRDALKSEIKADKRPGAGYVGLLVHERFDRIWLLRCPRDPTKEGLTIAQVAERRGVDPWTAFFDTIVDERDQAVGLFDYMDLEEIKRTLQHPLVMICSDGWVAPKEERTSATAPYQPCTYGEFPGILERFVRDEPVLRLEDAIHKMTGMPAARLGLMDRGLLREGFAADVVVFDLSRVRDRATNLWPHAHPFENYPHAYPEGIDWVLVNGSVAVDGGRPTGVLAGRVLRHRV